MTNPSNPARPTLVSDNTPASDTDNPFPPEAPIPGQTVTPPPRTITAMRGSWLARDVKEAIISGAARHGSDGTGTGGMPGYLEMCAREYPKEYMGLLARLVPLQARNQDGANASINIGSVNIHPVASDRYLTASEMREMATPVVEHVPTDTDTPDFFDPPRPPETPRDTPDPEPAPITDPPDEVA